MNNSVSSRRASRRRGCRRNNRQRGGAAGMAYTIGGPVTGQHVINNYDGVIQRFPSCEEATRPGYLLNVPIKGGLPGFAGGGRRKRRESSCARKSRRASRRSRRTMRGGRGGVLETGAAQLSQQMGGRYTFEPAVVGGVGMMEPRYSGCGDGTLAEQNQFNKGDFPASVITAPPAQVPTPTPQGGGRRRRTHRRRQHGGVGGVDSMFYSAPRSGYTMIPSNVAGGSGGALGDGKVPYEDRVAYSPKPVISPNCTHTGGRRRRHRKASRKASRKTRRKGNRK
jgi:hypothetical protein